MNVIVGFNLVLRPADHILLLGGCTAVASAGAAVADVLLTPSDFFNGVTFAEIETFQIIYGSIKISN